MPFSFLAEHVKPVFSLILPCLLLQMVIKYSEPKQDFRFDIFYTVGLNCGIVPMLLSVGSDKLSGYAFFYF